MEELCVLMLGLLLCAFVYIAVETHCDTSVLFLPTFPLQQNTIKMVWYSENGFTVIKENYKKIKINESICSNYVILQYVFIWPILSIYHICNARAKAGQGLDVW